ncbi:MAG TPA: peptide ABC transporter substrate-binding protein, partial [Kofleriaceae bacterium]|nr:peptide ABC transporter substrate-binding protein [Kofleriaceae bacterium]
GATDRDAYATVPAGEQVTIIEFSPDRTSAYVLYSVGDGVYGWVPTSELTGQPNGDVKFTVRAVPPEHLPGVDLPPAPDDAPRPQATVAGRDLLMLPEVLGISAPDDYTLIVESWSPVHIIMDLAADPVFRPSPRKVVSRWPKQWSQPEHIVTSGPLHMVEWDVRDKIVLVKSKTFWDQSVVKTPKFTVYSIDDQAASANLYMTGYCDAVAGNNVPASYLPVLSGEKRGGHAYADYTNAPFLGVYMYLVNVDRFPNVHYRRALSLAVDRKPMPLILHGGQIPSAQYVPGTPISRLTPEERALCGVTADQAGAALIVEQDKLCYVPAKGLRFDPEAAKKELALARQEMGDKFRESFTVRFNSGSEGHKLVAEYLQLQWKKVLGLDVALESQEWKTFLKSTASGNYDVARMGWIGSYPSAEDFVKLGKCGSPNNRTNFCDPEFERLYDLAQRESDRKQRLAYLQQAEAIFVQKAALIPLYIYTQQHLRKPYVRDLAINLFSRPGLFRAWIDPDWEQHLSAEDKN